MGRIMVSRTPMKSPHYETGSQLRPSGPLINHFNNVCSNENTHFYYLISPYMHMEQVPEPLEDIEFEPQQVPSHSFSC